MTDQYRLRLSQQQCLNPITGLFLPVIGQQGAGVEIKHQ
jgi:hypothetical protein